MLKISKNEFINEDMIECISIYESKPLQDQAKKARDENRIRELKGRYGIKSFVMMEDGYLFLCPNFPDIYLKRMSAEQYLIIDPIRYYLKKNMIREITSKPNSKQRTEIAGKKKDGQYINLAKNRPVRYYVFMKSGRIYGIALMKDLPTGKKGDMQ